MVELENDKFNELRNKYGKEIQEQVVWFLFDKNKWVYDNTFNLWRKVGTNDEDVYNVRQEVLFRKPCYDFERSTKEYVDWWFQVYEFCKAYLEEKHVFIHEPIQNMVDKAKISLLVASAVYTENLEDVCLRDGKFVCIQKPN